MLKDLTAEDVYKIYILNNKTQVNSKGYWEYKFDGMWLIGTCGLIVIL